MNTASWIRWFDEVDTAREADGADEQQLDVVGGKGANLGRLSHLGLPVPPGFVITTAAYRAFLAANELERLGATDPGSLRARIPQVPLPDDLSAALLAACQRLGAVPVGGRAPVPCADLRAGSCARRAHDFRHSGGS